MRIGAVNEETQMEELLQCSPQKKKLAELSKNPH